MSFDRQLFRYVESTDPQDFDPQLEEAALRAGLIALDDTTCGVPTYLLLRTLERLEELRKGKRFDALDTYLYAR